jgi:hypothetical protein
MSYQPVKMLEDWTLPPPMVMPVPGTTALAQTQTSSGWGKKVLILVIVLIGALLLLMLLGSMLNKKKRVQRNPIKRLSTPELAKQLYARLERKGDANPATMRSLAAHARKR